MLYSARRVRLLPSQPRGGILIASQATQDMDSQPSPDPENLTHPEPIRGITSDHSWSAWGDALRRRHLQGLAAWLLDVGRPLALVSAQVLYVGRPFLGEAAGILARLLESEDETAEFLQYLDPHRGGAA
jgi:hypothetical protein